jgi:hypothetical protein
MEAPIKKLVSQSLDHASFTDGTSTSGYIDFTTGQIPANSLVLGWKAVISEAFAGDTTGVITVGVSGGTGNYTGDTDLSGYTAATVGSAVAEATGYQVEAATPRVTVTGTADWGNVTAGTMVVTIYYLECI